MSDTRSPVDAKDEIKVSKIETFVLKNSWVFVKISTDAGIAGWGEMLKDDAKACAAGALEVADYLVGRDPRAPGKKNQLTKYRISRIRD